MSGTLEGLLAIATNFSKKLRMLRYLKAHSSYETYTKVKNSLKIFYITLPIFCLIGLCIVDIGMGYLLYKIDLKNTANDIAYEEKATEYVGDDISPVFESSLTVEEKKEMNLVIFFYISSLVLLVVALLILRQWLVNGKSKHNPAREWMTYVRWYNKNEIDEYWFSKDSETYKPWYHGLND